MAFFPQCNKVPNSLKDIVKVFFKNFNYIDSSSFELNSNEVLSKVTTDLQNLSYRVELDKKKENLIKVPVLFGLNGEASKSFYADAYNEALEIVIEVEAGRAVTNYQFLKDMFQACVMQNVEYLVIAVRNQYRNQKDFEIVITFMDTLYASQRLHLPLKGIMIIGY